MQTVTSVDQQFEQIVQQYEKMIYYLIHKLNIRDQDGEFFQEGMVALWEAYQKYGDRDTFGKLAYLTINSRLIDLIRKNSRIIERETQYDFTNDEPTYDQSIESFDPMFWSTVQDALTKKQWTFVQKRIIEGKPYKEIAKEESCTVDAVKGWGKEVKRKLAPLLKDYAE